MTWRTDSIAPLDEPEGFGVLGEKYLSDLAVQKYSQPTLDGKRQTLRRFAHWCQVRDLTRPEQITLELAERYQHHLHHYRKDNDQPLSIGSQRSRMTAVKMFFRWLAKKGFLSYSPIEAIELPKLPQQLPKAILSEQEAEQVLAQPNLDTAIGLRDRAIIETLYSTAIRRSECLNLNVTDIDHHRGLLRITQGKGRKDRIIPIGDRAIQWVDHYLKEARPDLIQMVAEPALFISYKGTRMHPTSMTWRLGNYIKQSGINKPGSVHIFRHTTATLMLENGADIRHIQAQLGHADLSTTQVYTRVAITHLKAVHEKTHPGRLNKDDENEAESN